MPSFSSPSIPFWGLLFSVLGLFLMGGSSRGDVQSLAILNPAMVIGCGVALVTFKLEHLRGKGWLAVVVASAVLLVALYLAPLPVQFDRLAADATKAVHIQTVASEVQAGQVLTLAPHVAEETLFFMFAPFAVFLFSLQLNGEDLQFTVPAILCVGAVSEIVGILQSAGNVSGPLYFYEITNNGSAVGLFANRNHSAVFLACLFPMLAEFARRDYSRRRLGAAAGQLVSIAIAVITVLVILVTGSRSGILVAIVGLIGGGLIYYSSSTTRRTLYKSNLVAIGAAASILFFIVFTSIFYSRAAALDRLLVDSDNSEDRFDFWASSLTLFWDYYPFGFGPGSFAPAFQGIEPIALLDQSYLNRLHNDWLELILTFGVPGILLLLVGTVCFFYRSFILWMRLKGSDLAVSLGRMASVVIAILAIASLFDYPLRTPAMAGFAALMIVLFSHAPHERYPGSLKERQKHS